MKWFRTPDMPLPIDPALHDAIVAARARSLARGRDWVAGDAPAALAAAFAPVTTLAAGEAVAAGLLADAGWVGALVGPLLHDLRHDPWFEIPLKGQRDTLRTGIVLFDGPAATVTLGAVDPLSPASQVMADHIVVGGRVSWTRYLRGGGAQLHRWRADMADAGWHAGIATTARPLSATPLADGTVLRHDGRRDAMLLVRPVAEIVTLTITLRHGGAPFMREYDRESGALRRVATLDDGAARTAMLLTLVRELGQGDAATFDAASRDPAFFVRWDAMREWLASDAASAVSRLHELTSDPHPDVRAAAIAMLPLVEARIGDRSCHR